MLLLLTILGILIPVISYTKERNDADNNFKFYDLDDFATDHLTQTVSLILSSIATLICCGAVCYLISACLEGNLLGRKIEMLQTQNADIEGKIEVVVKEYMSYENQTYLDLKPSQMVIFAASYPALQSVKT